MRDLKIGKLVFRSKAVQLIVLAFFLDGIILGAFIAASVLGNSGINIFLLLALLFPVWIPLLPTISKNVEEVQ